MNVYSSYKNTALRGRKQLKRAYKILKEVFIKIN